MPSVSKLRINGVEYDLSGGGGGGTTNYNDLSNKPQINGNTLSGNKTSAQLGLASSSDIPDVSTKYDSSDTIETTLDSDDKFPFYDNSASTRKNTKWSNIKAKLKSYFDDIYATISALNNKVDKVSGKGLSTNDYTTADKNKVDSLKDLAYIAKDGTSSTKYLKGDGTWEIFPTIPTVGNGTLTIQKNGDTVKTFTANQSGNVEANITVPTTAADVNAVKYDGNLTSLGQGTPASAAKTYFENNVANNNVEVAYNNSGTEYSMIFSRGGSNQYGNILKWSYYNKYLYILRKQQNTWKSDDWEKISAGYADTAELLATTRNINLSSDFTGSASFNGGSDATINCNFYNAGCNSGNTANYPWHRIAKVEGQTGQYVDKEALLLIRATCSGGSVGLVKIALRTNSTNTDCSVTAKWLYRYGFNENDIIIAHWGTTGQSVYADVFLKRGQWARTIIYQVVGNRSFTLVASNEVDNTTTSDKKTSYEVWKTVEIAAIEIHNKAYTSTVEAEDGGSVNYAKTAGSATDSTKVAKTGDTMTGALIIDNSVSDTPLTLKGNSSTSAWMLFKNNLNGDLAHLGIEKNSVSDIRASVYYLNTSHQLAYKSDLNAKQDTLVSGTNIKTINGVSVLGNGNLAIGANVPINPESTDGLSMWIEVV